MDEEFVCECLRTLDLGFVAIPKITALAARYVFSSDCGTRFELKSPIGTIASDYLIAGAFTGTFAPCRL